MNLAQMAIGLCLVAVVYATQAPESDASFERFNTVSMQSCANQPAAAACSQPAYARSSCSQPAASCSQPQQSSAPAASCSQPANVKYAAREVVCPNCGAAIAVDGGSGYSGNDVYMASNHGGVFRNGLFGGRARRAERRAARHSGHSYASYSGGIFRGGGCANGACF